MTDTDDSPDWEGLFAALEAIVGATSGNTLRRLVA
jgi:hypothetical protein